MYSKNIFIYNYGRLDFDHEELIGGSAKNWQHAKKYCQIFYTQDRKDFFVVLVS